MLAITVKDVNIKRGAHFIMNNDTTLSIAHNIFLTKEQRYSLQQEGAELEVVGISVPIWYHKGRTSEPAVEVFAKYKFKISDTRVFIKHNIEGYEISFPPKPIVPDVNGHQDVSAIDLLDIKDKGIMEISFRQHTKAKNLKKEFNVLHYVKIKDMNELKNSIET